MEVRVNVYDISGGVNKWVGWMGLGAYHTGVHIGDREYTFSNSGVIFHTPFEAGEAAQFREAVVMGEVPSMSVVNGAVAELRASFAPGTYNLTRQNCNHFTEALVQKLLGKSIPSYVNRSARLGSSFAPKDTTAEEEKPKPKPKRATKPAKPKTERPDLSDKQRAMLDKLKKKKADGAQ